MCIYFMFKPLFWVSFTTYCKIKRLMFRLLHIITWNLDVGNNDIRSKRSVSVIVSTDTTFCDRQSVIGLKNPDRSTPMMALFHCMARHSTVQYGSHLGGFPLGTVPGTFFSTTSAEVPSEPYRYQNMTCKLCRSLIGRRK